MVLDLHFVQRLIDPSVYIYRTLVGRITPLFSFGFGFPLSPARIGRYIRALLPQTQYFWIFTALSTSHEHSRHRQDGSPGGRSIGRFHSTLNSTWFSYKTTIWHLTKAFCVDFLTDLSHNHHLRWIIVGSISLLALSCIFYSRCLQCALSF